MMRDLELSRNDIVAAASELGLALRPSEIEVYAELIAGTVAAYRRLAVLAGPSRSPPTRMFRRSDIEEDPFNAFAVLTEVSGAPEGPLAGLRVALKDTIALAGVPLGVGTSVLDGFVPTDDATVVSRILAAGATIVGKTNCECLCASGASFTSSAGVVRNPHRPDHTAGGSSSGSAVAVATGQAELAVGGDQGGSIRVPAAACGIVGLKPTYGLVPYSGVFSGDATIDHLGPMSRSVADNSRLLAVIAGADGLDPRQRVPVGYSPTFSAGPAGLRVGVVSEGFGGSEAMPEVGALVRDTVARATHLGVAVAEISIPMHADGLAIWMPVILEGTLAALLADGAPPGVGGFYMPDFVRRLSAWKRRPEDLSDVLRVLLVAGRAITARQGNFGYATAHNLGRRLAAAYDAALSQYDILAMPTLKRTASPLPAPNAGLEERFARAVETVTNTAPFDLTGHPALSLPVGAIHGLPVGLMLIGRRFEEATLYRLAAAIEDLVGGPPPVVRRSSLNVPVGGQGAPTSM
jgi:amidase